ELDHMFALQQRNALVAMLGAEPIDDLAIGVLCARPRRPKCGAGKVRHGQSAQRAGNGALGPDWRGLSGKRMLIGRHELGRPRQTGQRYSFEAGATEVPARSTMPVNEAVHILRRPSHQILSHSLPPDGVSAGFFSSSRIATSISPCALIL